MLISSVVFLNGRYMQSGFKELKMCLRIEISCVPRVNKGFENLIKAKFVRKKIESPRKQYTSFSLVT